MFLSKINYLRTVQLVLVVVLFSLSSCIKDRVEPPLISNIISPGNKTLIHYWDFNDVANLITPTSTIGGGAIATDAAYDDVTPGSSLNLRGSSDSASALRVRNPSNTMTISLPTTGYKEPVLSFVVMRTSSGAQSNIISYTVDGTNFITTGISSNTLTVTETWTAYSIDFSSITDVNNNSNFAVRITFDVGNTGTSGNDRYDNITLDALPQ